jgi:SAM-dependent methyltransferase
MDARGVDVFYGGGTSKQAAVRTGLFGVRIFELAAGAIPMPDASVDVVVANMVFEHIDDFEPALREIARVLREGGVFLNVFPSSSVWREGHVGLPFVHRFAKDDFGARLGYAQVLRRLGLGYHKGRKDAATWARDALTWLDRWTHYKPLAQIERAFARHFSVARIDDDFVVSRLRLAPRLRRAAPLAAWKPFSPLMAYVGARLATHVFVLRKRDVVA